MRLKEQQQEQQQEEQRQPNMAPPQSPLVGAAVAEGVKQARALFISDWKQAELRATAHNWGKREQRGTANLLLKRSKLKLLKKNT